MSVSARLANTAPPAKAIENASDDSVTPEKIEQPKTTRLRQENRRGAPHTYREPGGPSCGPHRHRSH